MAPKRSKSSKVFKDPPKGSKVKVPKPSPIAHLLTLGDQETFQSRYDHAIDRFRTAVQVNGRQAYRDLVYEIKEIVSSLFPDEVANADTQWIVASIPSPTATNFQSDMSIEEVTERVDPVGSDDQPYKIDLDDLSQVASKRSSTGSGQTLELHGTTSRKCITVSPSSDQRSVKSNIWQLLKL